MVREARRRLRLLLAAVLFAGLASVSDSGFEAAPIADGAEASWRAGSAAPQTACKKRKKRRTKRRRKAKPAPTPAPKAEPAASDLVPSTSFRGPTRIDFDDRLIQGQTNKSGAVYLFDRKETGISSMVKRRKSFRRLTIQTIYDR